MRCRDNTLPIGLQRKSISFGLMHCLFAGTIVFGGN